MSRAITTTAGSSLRKVDTIVDTRQGSSLRKVDSYDSGVTKSVDAKLDKESSVSNYKGDAGTPVTTVPTQQILPNTEYKEIMSNIMDFKIDVKLEVQRINQKIGRLEELLSELVVKLSESSGRESSREGRLEGDELDNLTRSSGQQRCIKVTARASSAIGVSSTTIPSGAGER